MEVNEGSAERNEDRVTGDEDVKPVKLDEDGSDFNLAEIFLQEAIDAEKSGQRDLAIEQYFEAIRVCLKDNKNLQADAVSYVNSILERIANIESNLYKLYERFDYHASRTISLAMGFAASMAFEQESPHTVFIVPTVYSHVYTLERHLPIIDALLNRSEDIVYRKGLKLANQMILLIEPNQLPSSFCDLLKKAPIDKSLIKIARYSSIKDDRTLALSIYKNFVARFNPSGRYQKLFTSLAEPDDQSGVRGLALMLYKDMVIADLNSAFVGHNLHRFLRTSMTAALPKAAESDLFENHDTIMGLLNLVRFLLLKDPKDTNAFGTWDMANPIKEKFLDPLRKALDLSRAHLLSELNSLKNGSPKVNMLDVMDIEVLNKQQTDRDLGLPSDHEEQAIRIALTRFDIMESVLVRVNEILQ